MYQVEHDVLFEAVRNGGVRRRQRTHDEQHAGGHPGPPGSLYWQAHHLGRTCSTSKHDLAPEETLKWGDSFNAARFLCPV